MSIRLIAVRSNRAVCAASCRSLINVSSNGRRRLNTQRDVFEEGDIVLLKQANDPDRPPILTKPLKHGRKVQSHRGTFEHDDIIGKNVRELIRSSRGRDARINIPSLAQYIILSPRLVTPVYPGDANLIVSLLDIHVSSPSPSRVSGAPPLEILEGGTGHGALTLHLARAIHAANPPFHKSHTHSIAPLDQGGETEDRQSADFVKEMSSWKASRRAILHTLDISPAHSAHAEKIVHGFRKGLYAGNVDFHVGDVSEFIENQLRSRATSNPFLSHVLLDLPGPQHHLEKIAQALHDDGTIFVFNPSITQIIECVRLVKSLRLPLTLEQVVQLETNTSAGKQWDVRLVKIRALSRSTERETSEAVDEKHTTVDEDERWEMVCRPKVGDRLVGGGFLGVWRRLNIDPSGFRIRSEPREEHEVDESLADKETDHSSQSPMLHV